MSPPVSCVIEGCVAIKERHPTIESLMDVNFGAGEAEASGLGLDLKTAAIPLDDVVVADHSLVSETANAIQVMGSGAPGFGRVARSAGEAAIVVDDERAQDAVGRIEIIGAGQAEFTGEPVLQHAPETFDAALA
jgi:hypothetical protein